MPSTPTFQRRKILRLLEAEDLSRRQVARALGTVEGLDRWIQAEASRRGLGTLRTETALAQLGTQWTRLVVKRFYLSPTAE